MFLKQAICIAVTLALYGCGGGGGGDSESTTTDTSDSTLSVSSSSDLNLVEGTASSASVSINYSGAGSLTYSVDFGSDEPNASWSYSNGVLKIDPKSLQHASSDRAITFTVTDGDVSQSITIPTHFENTTGDVIERKAEALISNYGQLYSLNELKKVQSAFASILDFEDITYSTTSIDSSLYTGVKDAFTQLKSALANYKSESITEDELQAFVDTSAAAYRDLANAELKVINQLVSYDSANMTQLPSLRSSSFNTSTGSNFIGNSDYGNYTLGVWEFNDEYSFLSDLIDPTASCTI